jgi:quercetin dioxygenase-like cupin family protein
MSNPTPRFTLVPVADRRTYWLGGQRQAVIVGAGQTGNRYALSHSTVAVGIGAFEHSHSREAEAFYVLSGILRFSLEGRTLLLERGAFLHVEPGSKYGFEAVGPDPSEVLILYAPAGLERFVAEAGIPDPADPARSQEAAAHSIEQAGEVFAAAPAYGVNYSVLKPAPT